MPQARITKTAPADYFRTFQEEAEAMRVLQEASSQNSTITRVLNRRMSITDEDAQKDLNGFEHVLRCAGIQPVSDPDNGLYASPTSDFIDRVGGRSARVLLYEFASIIQRRAVFNTPRHRMQTRLTSLGDLPPGSVQRPYFYDPDIYWTQEIQPSIPLSAVVSRTQDINELNYRAYHVTYSAAGLRMTRVGEAAPIPMANLARSDNTIDLKKYARGMLISHERLASLRVDEFAEEIAFVLAQMEVDKLAAFIDISVNGDGNAGTAATVHNLTSLDSNATVNNLTSRAYRAFRRKFTGAYILMAVLAQDAMTDQLEEVNIGSANIPLADARVPAGHRLAPINTVAPEVAYGWTEDAPANNFVGYDTRRSPKHLMSSKHQYQDTQANIETMTEMMVLADYSGFAVIDANGTRVLNNAA